MKLEVRINNLEKYINITFTERRKPGEWSQRPKEHKLRLTYNKKEYDEESKMQIYRHSKGEYTLSGVSKTTRKWSSQLTIKQGREQWKQLLDRGFEEQ
jgi:hypothetical protein